uniref:FZ domain-containing protein n=1 Tax=Apteryx owenii TaxID=8824 RepID=A0A8B9PZ01_APTOW
INITNSLCQMLPYNYTTLTSVLSIVKSIEMEKFLKFFSYLNRLSCYQHIMLFGCSLALPECISDGDDRYLGTKIIFKSFCGSCKPGCELNHTTSEVQLMENMYGQILSDNEGKS